MRWLMIALLVSLGALLFAAAGLARHIWLQRTQIPGVPVTGDPRILDQTLDPVEESDLEVEP